MRVVGAFWVAYGCSATGWLSVDFYKALPSAHLSDGWLPLSLAVALCIAGAFCTQCRKWACWALVVVVSVIGVIALSAGLFELGHRSNDSNIKLLTICSITAMASFFTVVLLVIRPLDALKRK